MEPTTVIATAKLISSAIKLSLKFGKAWNEKGLGKSELEAAAKALDSLPVLRGLHTQGAPSLPAQHLALVSGAFGVAVKRHWAGNPQILKLLKKEIDTRARHAALKLVELGDSSSTFEEYKEVDRLTRGPLNTPYYQSLWHAYTSPDLDDDDNSDKLQAPLLRKPGMRREFETHFLLAYCEGLSSQGGSSVSAMLEQMGEHRRRAMHVLLAQDMATWGARHVFGNVAEQDPGDVLPFLPLNSIYVEPMAKLVDVDTTYEPVQDLLNDSIKTHTLTILKGDFGMGKSLSARMLARRLALEYLETLEVSTGAYRPIFVRCVDDFVGGDHQLDTVVTRAQKRAAKELNIDLQRSDPAFEIAATHQKGPADTEHTLFILDGLDEVLLGEAQLDHLFRDIQDSSSENHRYVVFSRPGALPKELPKDAAVLEIQLFNTGSGGQVDQWLNNWDECAQRPEEGLYESALEKAGLLELCRTPILLLMVAQTWRDLRIQQGTIPQASVYEMFFRNIARGKIEMDPDRNPVVSKASESLREKLLEFGELGSNSENVDAMLWLMSRVAWEKQKLGHADEPEPLTTHHVNNIIHNELKLGADADVFARIRLGLLLAMQAELKAGMHRILWGHQSFFEFLVARYWALKLRRIIGTPPYHPERKEIEKSLFGAPVLGGDNRIFRFLKEILNSDPWTDNDRTGLHDWAKECFEDDEQYFGDDPVTIRNDRRVPLRMTALAIGCSLSDHEPLEDQSGEHLRSLIAWHFQRGEHCQLFAPGLKATDVYLRGANLNGANLSDAHLRGANLSNANLHGAILIDAHLRGAILIDANLSGAILINANLHGAILIDANLSDARLSNANLSDARLRDARYNNNTQFPDGFGNPEERGMIKVE